MLHYILTKSYQRSGFMYNSIRKASVCFMQRYSHTPSRVLLSKNQYLALVNEMYGLQQEFLIKNNITPINWQI